MSMHSTLEGVRRPGDPIGFAEFLRRNRELVLSDWERGMRGIPAADVDVARLRGCVPVLLDQVIDAVEGRGERAADEKTPDAHPAVRMDPGVSLEEMARDYLLLRRALLRSLERLTLPLPRDALLLLDDAIDQAILRAIAAYFRVRTRRLEAINRISREGFAAPESLDALLHRLLWVMVDTIDAVDTGMILLREWDRLVLRAAVGVDESAVGHFSVAIGDGFAGVIAARKEPLSTPSAATDRLIEPEILRRSGLRTLHGVPLVYRGVVIGVAEIGSRTVDEFSDDDRLVFQAIAERAAALITVRRLSEERDRLLGVIGHDLRVPLSTITLSASAMRRRGDSLPEAATRHVERIVRSAQHMDRMIADLTDYTKVRATGELPLERQVLDLHELAQQVAGELRVIHSSREIRVETSGHGDGAWDRSRLARAITNLVSNAVAYGAPSTPVTIAVDGDDETTITLRVHNEGPPIDPVLLPHVFEPFRRGSAGTGTGLGLYVVQQVARAHGGTVEVESTPQEGTTFRVCLPRLARPGEP